MVADLSRAQRRVEAIITALGQLASGQLAQAEDREFIDVADLLERVARENMRPPRRWRWRWRPTTARHGLGLARRLAAGHRQPGAQRDHPRRGDQGRAGRPPA